MAKYTSYTFNGPINELVDLSGSDMLWIFDNDCSVTNGYLTSILEDGNGNKIVFKGTLASFNNGNGGGIGMASPGAIIEIARTGTIVAEVLGVSIRGEGASVINYGNISTTEVGFSTVNMLGTGERLDNYGVIQGDQGIRSTEAADIFNHAGATIFGSDYAVALWTGNSGEQNKLVNDGTIQGGRNGSATAISGDSGAQTVINTGFILGNVTLQNGNDRFDGRGGRIDGNIDGGDGNDRFDLRNSGIVDTTTVYGSNGDDILTTDTAKAVLIEQAGGGTESVKSTVTYRLSENVESLYLLGSKDIDGRGNESLSGNYLEGNSGDNRLSGLAGNDGLRGKGGNDFLIGGDGNDRFYFATGYAKDTIVDFASETEKIDVMDWKAIQDYSSLRSHASDHGKDVWITANHDTLVIENMHRSELRADDFIF